MEGSEGSLVKHFIGPYIKVFLAWASDSNIRRKAASGGVGTALLMYMLKEGLVDVVITPRLRVSRGSVYGVWTIVKDPDDLSKFSGSIYAPTYGFAHLLRYAMKKFRRIAITAVPCYAKAARSLADSLRYAGDLFIVGPYCGNTPSTHAVRYLGKVFRFDPAMVESIKFRGNGWPGYMEIRLKNTRNKIFIPHSKAWDSGFGQYFYGLGCYVCTDPTGTFTDVSLADPWTLSYELIKSLGGATLVIVRTPRGLDVFKGAVENGYIKAIAINPIYAIQLMAIFKLTKRVLLRSNQNYLLPPSFSSIMQELVYHLGSFLASREKLWGLLKLFHGVPRNILMFVASVLDFKLGTEWSHIVKSIELLQRAHSENVSTLLKNYQGK
jgi:coenzyme F420 hydrogenase subunit beta